ncbi:MAG: 4Fe-4S dicluster domain-containing protein, partial [Planctomycetota bacterium]
YGRFQSVMLDRSSLVVGYDVKRGEPRGRGRNRAEKGLGDCVDCHLCVDVCPTGIDIRDGLQMECVNCTQCIDACDRVMEKVGKPKGLIRYSSQAGLDGVPTRIIRPRVLIYSAIITAVAVLFIALLASRSPYQVTLLRGLGRPFVVRQETSEVENLVRVKIVNRTDEEEHYQIAAVEPAGLRIDGEDSFALDPQGVATEPLHLVAPASVFVENRGIVEAKLQVTNRGGKSSVYEYRLFGPAEAASDGQ